MPGQAPMESGVPVLPAQLQLRFANSTRAPRGQEETVPCEHCGKPNRIPVWIARRKFRLHFCGKACLDAWTSVLPKEGKRLVLKGRPEYRGGNWKVQSARARERDGFRCRNCGVTEASLGRQLDVHHATPVRLFASTVAANRPGQSGLGLRVVPQTPGGKAERRTSSLPRGETSRSAWGPRINRIVGRTVKPRSSPRTGVRRPCRRGPDSRPGQRRTASRGVRTGPPPPSRRTAGCRGVRSAGERRFWSS